MKRIAILIKTTKPEAKIIAEKIENYFIRKKDYRIFTKLNQLILKRGLDWIIVLGGDGAMLHVANEVASCEIPLIGVNLGHKGYLCRIKKQDLTKALGSLNSGNFSVNSYTRIKARIIRQKRVIKEIEALNEIVVGGINRAVWLELKISRGSKRELIKVVGDGIILSTQIGSTAYNVYSGGPILMTDVFSVVACNALFESNYFLPNTKAFVIPTSARFQIKTLRGGQHLLYVIADGQKDYKLQKGEEVIVTRSSRITKLIELTIF